MEALKQEETFFTYSQYAAWETDERFELIDGVAYAMAAPSTPHQAISMELSRQFGNYLKGKRCRVFAAPFDVCLNALGDDDYTVVQPDLIIVCDPSKLDGKRCNGAPDMAIEILSPSSSDMDMFKKFAKYQQAGVSEYWMVNPVSRMVYAHILKNGRYFGKIYGDADIAPVSVLEDCKINLADVFAEA